MMFVKVIGIVLAVFLIGRSLFAIMKKIRAHTLRKFPPYKSIFKYWMSTFFVCIRPTIREIN
jgi:hypothetical protein